MSADKPPPHGPILELVCPPRTDMLSLIRRVVAATAQETGFSPEEAHSIAMCVDEACANVIRHAYGARAGPGGEAGEIRIQVCPGDDCLAIRVIDSGRGLPAAGACGVSSIEEYARRARPCGLGTYIIGRFMDKVTYDSPIESGTILSMVKYRHGEAKS